jgi:hypothetical protein
MMRTRQSHDKTGFLLDIGLHACHLRDAQHALGDCPVVVD